MNISSKEETVCILEQFAILNRFHFETLHFELLNSLFVKQFALKTVNNVMKQCALLNK